MSTETNKELVRTYFAEVWSKGDPAAFDRMLTADFRDHDPSMPPEMTTGIGGNREAVKMFRGAFPDLKFTVDELVAEGDRVVARFTGVGTHKGDLMGLAPTGKKISVTGTSTSRIKQDKIAESWTNWDAAGMAQQIGGPASAESAQNIASVRRLIDEAYNKGNVAVIDELVGASYVRHDTSAPGVKGPAGLRQLALGYRTAFPDIKFVVDDAAAQGNTVYVRYTITGTHRGEFRGIPATGKRFSITGMTSVRCESGKLMESWHNLDFLGLVTQLGIVQAPAALVPA